MVFITAEIGINHNGDINIAKQLIDIAKKCDCDAVKFQKRSVEKVYSQETLDTPRESPWGTTTREQKLGLEFEKEEYDIIDAYCKERKINWITLMGVPVGFGGQPFDTNVFAKLVSLREFSTSNNLKLELEIDGGLSFENIKLCKNLGANFLAGWSIINSKNIHELNKRIKKLKKILN